MSELVARSWRAVWWYLREVTGESAYERYVEHERHAHPGRPVASRREFERKRQDLASSRPQQRCC
jgi:uncharacterized short protein YbdD (DUF466 family)